MVNYLRKLPRANPPGTKFHYNTGETDLAGVLASKATSEPSGAVGRLEKIWQLLRHGADDAIWMTDPGGQQSAAAAASR